MKRSNLAANFKVRQWRGAGLLAAIAVVVLGAAPSPAQGQTVTFNFRATVTGTGGLSAFSVGDTITGSYTFDVTAPDLDASPEIGEYLAVVSWSLTTSQGYSASATAAMSKGNIGIHDDIGNLTRDRYVVNVEEPEQSIIGPSVDGLAPVFFTIVLRSSLTTALPSDALPLFPPSLADFDRGNELNLAFGFAIATATLTSLTVDSVDPVTQISAIMTAVQALESGGTLKFGQSVALQAKLAAAADQAAKQPRAAIGILTAFLQQVAALAQNGSLSAQQGQFLTAAAVQVIAQLL